MRRGRVLSLPVAGRSRRELVVLSTATRYARGRTVGSDPEEVVLRSSDLWRVVPGEVATVRVRESYRHLGETHWLGEIQRVRFDPGAFGLEPVHVTSTEAASSSERRLVQSLPGPGLWECAVSSLDEGISLAHELLERDVRCLDAHAYLGDVVQEADPSRGLRHFTVGVGIGDYSLGERMAHQRLPWDPAGNAGFLRCLHGRSRCLWRLDRLAEAEAALRRLLALDPRDPLEAKFELAGLRARRRRAEPGQARWVA